MYPKNIKNTSKHKKKSKYFTKYWKIFPIFIIIATSYLIPQTIFQNILLKFKNSIVNSKNINISGDRGLEICGNGFGQIFPIHIHAGLYWRYHWNNIPGAEFVRHSTINRSTTNTGNTNTRWTRHASIWGQH